MVAALAGLQNIYESTNLRYVQLQILRLQFTITILLDKLLSSSLDQEDETAAQQSAHLRVLRLGVFLWPRYPGRKSAAILVTGGSHKRQHLTRGDGVVPAGCSFRRERSSLRGASRTELRSFSHSKTG